MNSTSENNSSLVQKKNGLGLIVFEGIEGCGKTTQIQLLAKRLKDECNITPLILREPGGTDIGEEIRKILKNTDYQDNMCNETELLLMNAARAQLVRKVIQPALLKGQPILCDRYYFSTLAYQGFGRGLPMQSLREITKYAIGNIQPQVVIFLDIPLEVSLERIQSRNKFLRGQGLEIKDRFEESGKAFFERVHQGFQELANEFPLIKKINANQSIEKVGNEVWMTIQQLLAK